MVAVALAVDQSVGREDDDMEPDMGKVAWFSSQVLNSSSFGSGLIAFQACMSVSMVAECFQREIEASIQHLDRRRQRLSVGAMPSPLAHTRSSCGLLVTS